MKNFISGCVIAASIVLVSSSASATDSDERFFQSIEGMWSGPGEILAGKYKGTKFVCKLEGSVPGFVAGMKLNGSCSMGIFSQSMKASVVRSGKTYQGEFNDGAEGKGLDIVSGAVVGDKVVLGLNRKELDGVMLAQMKSDKNMNVTISIQVDDDYIPVVDMNLKRVVSKDGAKVAGK